MKPELVYLFLYVPLCLAGLVITALAWWLSGYDVTSDPFAARPLPEDPEEDDATDHEHDLGGESRLAEDWWFSGAAARAQAIQPGSEAWLVSYDQYTIVVCDDSAPTVISRPQAHRKESA